MITYVNTVLVSNADSYTVLNTVAPQVSAAAAQALKGNFVVQSLDDNGNTTSAPDENTDKIRIGVILGTYTTVVDKSGVVKYLPDVKWSNEIKKNDIKSYRRFDYVADTEDNIVIDFDKATTSVKNALADGGKSVVLRLTFKDLPTRFRNWTESYSYVTAYGDDEAAIATALAAEINKQTKRARVTAVANAKKLTLTAMPYDDDNSNDTINLAGKVRFNATLYWQDPQAAGFASSNKNPMSNDSAFVVKTEGKQYTASAKLVRDREALSIGYQGILNHGECTWPIIKPAMETDITKHYNGLTLEFENMYRAADDIFRKTKQTVEIYTTGTTDALEAALADFVGTPATDLNDTASGVAYEEPIA